jgi:hypothetical protein
MILVILSAVTVPLQVAFDSDFQHDQQLIDTWSTVDTAFDLLFIGDILLNFRTGFVQRGLFIRNSRLIADAYVRSSFAIDVRIDRSDQIPVRESVAITGRGPPRACALGCCPGF